MPIDAHCYSFSRISPVRARVVSLFLRSLAAVRRSCISRRPTKRGGYASSITNAVDTTSRRLHGDLPSFLCASNAIDLAPVYIYIYVARLFPFLFLPSRSVSFTLRLSHSLSRSSVFCLSVAFALAAHLFCSHSFVRGTSLQGTLWYCKSEKH